MSWCTEPTWPPDSLYSLWFYPSVNRFENEDGWIMHNLSDRFDVWQLEEWKKTKDYACLVDKQGNLCELFYMDEDDDHFLTTSFLSRPVKSNN